MNICTTLVALAAISVFFQQAVAAGPLNVLFVAVDDMRNDAGCYGHPQAMTPNIDRLAKMGVRFDRAYCQQALCNPSRASLLCGQRPDTLGVWNLTKGLRDADPNVVTLPQLFKQNGYVTQGIGKIFHNWRTADQGDPQSWSVPAVLHYARHDDDLPMTDGELPADAATAPRCMCLDVPDNAYFDGRIAEHAVDALQARGKDKRPFFLAVGFWKPHLPFNPPAKYWNMYDRNQISMPEHPQPTQDVPDIALHDNREIMRAAGKDGLSDAEIRELRHGYLAGISFLDAQLGKVLDELERQDLTKNTVIVFWSDHGFHLGENSLWCKTSNFERDARIPLIVAVPGSTKAGAATSSLVELVDLYPTLTELCALPAPDGLDGTSLVPILNHSTATVKQAAFTQHPRPAYYQDHPEIMGVSVRTSRYRYTEWRHFDTGVVTARELYDHQIDPDETKNVAADASGETLTSVRKLIQKQFPDGGWRDKKSNDAR
jgi:iduronate 2-sulfatase